MKEAIVIAFVWAVAGLGPATVLATLGAVAVAPLVALFVFSGIAITAIWQILKG